MAKKHLSYPQDTPNSIQDISKKYIEQFFAVEVHSGKVSIEQLQKWVKTVKEAEEAHKDSPVKAFNKYREAFVSEYMPRLLAKSDAKASDFYASLLAEATKGKE